MGEGNPNSAERSVALTCDGLRDATAARIFGEFQKEKAFMKSMLKKVVGIQMEGVLEWLRRLRYCARLDRLIFSAIMVSLWSDVFVAQTFETFECDQQCPKTRELVTAVWDGAFTLFVLSLDSGGKRRYS